MVLITKMANECTYACIFYFLPVSVLFVCLFFLNLANSINKIQFIPIYNHTITFIKGILKKEKKNV